MAEENNIRQANPKQGLGPGGAGRGLNVGEVEGPELQGGGELDWQGRPHPETTTKPLRTGRLSDPPRPLRVEAGGDGGGKLDANNGGINFRQPMMIVGFPIWRFADDLDPFRVYRVTDDTMRVNKGSAYYNTGSGGASPAIYEHKLLEIPTSDPIGPDLGDDGIWAKFRGTTVRQSFSQTTHITTHELSMYKVNTWEFTEYTTTAPTVTNNNTDVSGVDQTTVDIYVKICDLKNSETGGIAATQRIGGAIWLPEIIDGKLGP